MVRFERFGGASGIIAVAATGTQFAIAGTAPADIQSLIHDRMRWEWTTMLRIVGSLGIIWFTAGLAARLRRLGPRPAGAASAVLGAGILWGTVWLLSALFNSAAISMSA